MAATWPLAVAGIASSTLSAARYMALGGEFQPVGAAEACYQTMLRGSYTFDQLWVSIGTNSRTDTVTVDLRKNGASGNQTVSVATTLTGVFEDTTHSDSFVTGDVGNYRLNPAGGSGSFTPRALVMRCQSASSEQLLITGGGNEPEGALLVHFMPIGGRVHSGTPQAISELRMYDSVTFRALRFNSSANTLDANMPLTFTRNSAAGNQTVTVTALTTGAFEDTTHSDSVVSGDLCYYRMDTTAAHVGQSVTPTIFQMTANTTVGRYVAGWHSAPHPTFGVIGYSPIEGRWHANPTETPSQTACRVAGTMYDLDVFTYDNTLNAASPVTLRVNGVASTLAVSLTTAATGRFRDTTHTVAIAATDLLVTQLDTTPSSSGDLWVANTLLMFNTTAATASFMYTPYKERLAKGQINLATADLRALLVMTGTTTDTQEDVASLSAFTTPDECDGSGYARVALTGKTVTRVDASDRAVFGASPTVFPTLGNGTRQLQAVILYEYVDGTAANDRPVAYLAVSGFPLDPAGQSLTVTWDATAGLFYLG